MIETSPWDVVDYLQSDEETAAYLEAAFEDGTPSVIYAAIGDIIRARSLQAKAAGAGVGKGRSQRGLKPDGKPRFGTVQKAVADLGFRLSVVPRQTSSRNR